MPVEDSAIDATIPFLPPVIADMVRFQRWTGCRPEEVCSIRPCDVDRSDDVWAYRPASHKTQHLGRDRVVFVGPQAQAVLCPYLLRGTRQYCFSPAESERRRRQKMQDGRTTPMSCGNRPGTNRNSNPLKTAGQCYSVATYRRAVQRAATEPKSSVGRQTGYATRQLPKFVGSLAWRPPRFVWDTQLPIPHKSMRRRRLATSEGSYATGRIECSTAPLGDGPNPARLSGCALIFT